MDPSKLHKLKRTKAQPLSILPNKRLAYYNGVDNAPLFCPHTFIPDTESCEKMTRGKQKIPIEFISDRTKRYSTFSKRKTGLMKKAVELAELTGAEVLLLVASETNHVYTFATQRLKGIIELDCGKKLIQTCLSANNISTGNLITDLTDRDLTVDISNVNPNTRFILKKDGKKAVNNVTETTPSNMDACAITDCYEINQIKGCKHSAANANITGLENPPLIISDKTIPTTALNKGEIPISACTITSENLTTSYCDPPLPLTTATSLSSNLVNPSPTIFSPSIQVNITPLDPLSSTLLLAAQLASNQMLLMPTLNSVLPSSSLSNNQTSQIGYELLNLWNSNTPSSFADNSLSSSLSEPTTNSRRNFQSTVVTSVSIPVTYDKNS